MVTNSSKHSPEERNEEFLHPPTSGGQRRTKTLKRHRRLVHRVSHGFHEHRRQPLDTPKSKEIKKLLQPVILNSPYATLRASKLLSKRHPDTIDVRMKCDRTFT
jgi:hypothetical protein